MRWQAKCAVFSCKVKAVIPSAFVALLCAEHARQWQASPESKRVANSTAQFDAHFMEWVVRIDAEERNGTT